MGVPNTIPCDPFSKSRNVWCSPVKWSCIEMAMDPIGPSMEEMLPTLERILARKPLILMNTTGMETSLAAEKLPAAGLCVIPRF